MKTFAQKLIEWRKAKRLPQVGAAEYLSIELGAEVSVRVIQEWEQGRKTPHGITMAALERTMEAKS